MVIPWQGYPVLVREKTGCVASGRKRTTAVSRIILETAVECARVCRDWRARQGETTEWASAHKAEQRSLARQARCNRVHSAVTQNVIVIEAGKVNIHAAFLMFASGQLRFLGSKIRLKFAGSDPVKRRCALG